MVDDDILDVEFKVIGHSISLRIGRKGILRLGNADWIVGDAHLFDELQHLA